MKLNTQESKSISEKFQFATIDELYLDPISSRFGRHNIGMHITQEDILEQLRSWVLEELALSYLESGKFWEHEALLAVREKLYGKPRLIVVDGNRRLAALKYLRDAYEGQSVLRNWKSIINKFPEPPANLFSEIPYILVTSREEVQAFIGFRHITGIKQWYANAKSEFIVKLIDEYNMTYEQVGHKIGNKTLSVRRHYIAYRILLQIEDTVEDFEPGKAEGRFAALYMAIDTEGAKQYLNINIMADPQSAKMPVPKSHLENLANFSRWLFGTKKLEPLVTDTRYVSDFGQILASEEAIQYLLRNKRPNFDIAFQKAGGDEAEIAEYIHEAVDNLEYILTQAHLFKKSETVQRAVIRLKAHSLQLVRTFPKIYQELRAEIEEEN